jgi:hypothetical protein
MDSELLLGGKFTFRAGGKKEDAATRFFEPKGTIRFYHSELNWQRFV